MSETQPDLGKERERVLAYEEFVAVNKDIGIPRYNNFHLFFIDYNKEDEMEKFFCKRLILDDDFDVVGLKSFYQKFKEGNQELEKELTAWAKENKGKVTTEALHKIEPQLYRAYQEMKKAGATDEELFV